MSILITKRRDAAKGSYQKVMNVINDIPSSMQLLLSCNDVDLKITKLFDHRNIKTNDLGMYDDNKKNITVVTSFYKNGLCNKVDMQTFAGIVLHELGHSIDYGYGGLYDVTKNLMEYIKKDIKKLPYRHRVNFNYYIYNETEMWAETFVYHAGGSMILGLPRKYFAKYFHNTIMETNKRLHTLIAKLKKEINLNDDGYIEGSWS